MKRRTFLQRSGVALAAIGLSQAGLSLICDRYYQALAQSSPRKLALLVGIDQYSVGTPLMGCVTDVDLQRELLIHRFGFNPSDILTLTDRQATRQNIETAFLEHLTKQVKAGDAVIFHFSGYGTRLAQAADVASLEENAAKFAKSQNLLLPVDGLLPTKTVPAVNAVTEETLWLLLQSLPTNLVTTVLDTSYSDGGVVLQGNVRVRSRPKTSEGILSEQELAFLTQLQQNTKAIAPVAGVVLSAAKPEQQATEGLIDGFTSGFFTYALTQHLWQATPATTVRVSLSQVASTVVQLVGTRQQPQLQSQNNSQAETITYHLIPYSTIGADGAVIGVEDSGKTGLLWLAGLPPQVLHSLAVNSLFTLVTPVNSDSETPPPPLVIRSREGLKTKAKINSPNPNETYTLQVGQLVWETIRVLPRNIRLIVALDASLERIERVDATSAFSAVPFVSSVTAGEQPADCLFGRVPAAVVSPPHTADSSGTQVSAPKTFYSLFSPGLEAVPNSAGEPGEAVKTAVNRLTPKLRTLLAMKLLRLTGNEASSRLGVKASLEIADTEKVLMERMTVRAPWPAPVTKVATPPKIEEGILSLPISSPILYRLHNYSDAPVYYIVLGIDPSGGAIAFLPPKFSQNPDEQASNQFANQVILPGETITIPLVSSPFKWLIQGPPGLAETQLIFSRAPLVQTLIALENAKLPGSQRVSALLNPLDVALAVLQDLHQASGKAVETVGASPDIWALDVNAWATFSFIYQVI